MTFYGVFGFCQHYGSQMIGMLVRKENYWRRHCRIGRITIKETA